MPENYDVIVVGGGHAGCEAALASARLGCSTLLITLHANTVGLMSCNPAIGGVGKGQLVKEIDALGGEMARAADACGIQFRMLNTSKGPAVQSSRAQVDRKKYCLYMQETVKNQENLDVYEGEVIKLIVGDNQIEGVETSRQEQVFGKTVVIAPGTFLNGLMHIGMRSFPGGRIEEKEVGSRHLNVGSLSDCLRGLGFRLLRFQTCTSARLDGRTIDFSALRKQDGDSPPKPFSFSTTQLNIKQVPCYITYTNKKTHSIIRNNLDRSPLFSGKIVGTAVRYCPSLEEKVVKFPQHNRHQIFLEPEGIDTDEYYPNGLFTSLPEDVQGDFIHSVPGLENVKINRFGYGIEHDVVEPVQLFPTLEAKSVHNLYLAGQINGSTGYEEAGAQGLIAGINAGLRVKDKPPLILDRSTSYIGVLIDDLVTKGTNEPYRMFTSRVEYRLLLREDNADLRLRKIGFELGLVSKEVWEKVRTKQEQIQEGIKYLKEKQTVSPEGKKISLEQFLKRPEVKIASLKEKIPSAYSEDVLSEMEIAVKYAYFIQEQLREVESFKNLEKIRIPEDLDYEVVPGLSREIREKLSKLKPLTLGQVSRISGVTPAAIIILMGYLRKIKSQNGK